MGGSLGEPGPPTGLPKLAPWRMIRNPSLAAKELTRSSPTAQGSDGARDRLISRALKRHPNPPSGLGAPAELDPAPVTAETAVRSSSCPRLTPLESIPSTTPAGFRDRLTPQLVQDSRGSAVKLVWKARCIRLGLGRILPRGGKGCGAGSGVCHQMVRVPRWVGMGLILLCGAESVAVRNEAG